MIDIVDLLKFAAASIVVFCFFWCVGLVERKKRHKYERSALHDYIKKKSSERAEEINRWSGEELKRADSSIEYNSDLATLLYELEKLKAENRMNLLVANTKLLNDYVSSHELSANEKVKLRKTIEKYL